jgi:hypothetical protein
MLFFHSLPLWAFEKVEYQKNSYCLVVSKRVMKIAVGVGVRGQGKSRGAFGFALNFFAPLFSGRKKWKT